MGQYHMPVNLDKKEFVHPHRLGAGLKLWEQLASHISTGTALVVLLASGSNGQGGGDLRTPPSGDKPGSIMNFTETTRYHPIIGQWRGNRIAFVGDYDEDTIYTVDGKSISGSKIYSACSAATERDDEDIPARFTGWTDVTDAVCAVIESELDGKFTGGGWREFRYNADETPAQRALKPDMLIVR